MDLRFLDNIHHLDKGSFETIFRTFYPMLVSFGVKILSDRDAASDIVQKVFIDLWEKREEVSTGRELKSYLFRSVHNRCLNHLRDNRKFVKKDIPEDSAMLQEYVNSGDRMEEEELRRRIDDSIEALPDKTRQVFLMSRFEGMKYREIAEKLDISVKTVENQMGRALRMLREALKDYLITLLYLLLWWL